MPVIDKKCLQISSTGDVRRAVPALHHREMSRDIEFLGDLLRHLRQIKAPLRNASNAVIEASMPDTRSEAEIKLDTLNNLVEALDTGMKLLIDAMTMHQAVTEIKGSIH